MLVLRVRPAAYRKPLISTLGDSIALRAFPGLALMLRDADVAYNRRGAALENSADGRDRGHLLQIAVPNHTRPIARLEANHQRVIDALRVGAQAMASAILAEPIDLCRQPGT